MRAPTHLRLVASPLLAALLLISAAPAASARPMGIAPVITHAMASVADPARRFRMNLGQERDFVAQTNFVQCVGASVQMMLNIERPGADRTARTQRQLQNLARASSGPAPDGFVRQGASIRGWAAALMEHGGGPYRIVGADSLDEAMRIAAVAIRTWDRPVGLLVWRGRHAWVMSGFVATADPLETPNFRVTRAYILDPLYPRGSGIWGPSPRPGAAIPVAAVGRQFVRRRIGGPWSALPGMAQLAGRYALLVPSGPGLQALQPGRQALPAFASTADG